jgi:glycosyltransferase involved in cell wall biosynthesis
MLNKPQIKNGIVIPFYNEEIELIDRCKEIDNFCLQNACFLILVNDGSTNDTGLLMQKVEFKSSKVISYDKNMGYGYANYAGAIALKDMGIERVVFMDSDGTNLCEDAVKLLDKLDFADLVKGSRYLNNSSTKEVSTARRILGFWANKLLKIMFKTHISDVTNGFRAFKLSHYLEIPLTEFGFSSIIEEFYFAKVMNLSITEEPTVLKSRSKNQKRTSAAFNLPVFWKYFKPGLRFRLQKNVKHISKA